MKWNIRCVGWILFFVVLTMAIHHHECRNLRRSSKPRRQDAAAPTNARVKGFTLQREQVRFLRKLLESSYAQKKTGWSSLTTEEDGDDDDDDEPPKKGWQTEAPSKRISKKQGSRKRVIDNNIDPSSGKLCCPQKYEIIEPNFGRNRTGHIVELYKDDRIQQRFYELICDPRIENQPCRFHHEMSRCTQQHVYTYALVQSHQSVSGWSLDHIRIRSGCVCKLYQPKRRTSESSWQG